MIVKTALDIMRTLPRCWQKPIPQGHLDIEKKYLKQLEPVIDKCAEGCRLSEFGEYVLSYLTNALKDNEDFDETLCVLIGNLGESEIVVDDSHFGEVLADVDVPISPDSIIEFIKRHSEVKEDKFENKCPKKGVKKCSKKCANKCTKKCCQKECPKGGVCITKMGIIKAKSPEELIDKMLSVLSEDIPNEDS